MAGSTPTPRAQGAEHTRPPPTLSASVVVGPLAGSVPTRTGVPTRPLPQPPPLRPVVKRGTVLPRPLLRARRLHAATLAVVVLAEALTRATKPILHKPLPLPSRPQRQLRARRVVGVRGTPPSPPLRPQKRPVRATLLARHGRGRNAARGTVPPSPPVAVRQPQPLATPAGRTHVRARVRLATQAVGATPCLVLPTRLLLQGMGQPEAELLPPVAAALRPPRRTTCREPGRPLIPIRTTPPSLGEDVGLLEPTPRGGRPTRLTAADAAHARLGVVFLHCLQIAPKLA